MIFFQLLLCFIIGMVLLTMMDMGWEKLSKLTKESIKN